MPIDHLGGIIDNHESEVRFGDKNRLETLRQSMDLPNIK